MKIFYYLSTVFLVLILFLIGLKFHLHLILSYILALNLVTFLLYCIDKSLAVFRLFRIPERLLHVSTLLGGSLGAFFGQYLCKHKTIKPEFQKQFWIIIAVQIMVLVIFFTLIVYWA
jgi:uncharacterized membrane protein YsdA (DUF1294 family)